MSSAISMCRLPTWKDESSSARRRRFSASSASSFCSWVLSTSCWVRRLAFSSCSRRRVASDSLNQSPTERGRSTSSFNGYTTTDRLSRRLSRWCWR